LSASLHNFFLLQTEKSASTSSKAIGGKTLGKGKALGKGKGKNIVNVKLYKQGKNI